MAYAFVAKGDAATSASGTSQTIASVTLLAHETVVVTLTYGQGSTTESVSDGTNTYTKVGSTYRDSGDIQNKATFVCVDAVAGTYTLTGTLLVAGDFRGLAYARYNGLDNTATPIGAGAARLNTGTGTDALTTGNLTPGSQPGMLFATAVESSGSGTTAAAGTGFTNEGAFTNWDSVIGATRVEDIRLTSVSAVAGTFTLSAATNSFLTDAVFIPESGGAVSITYPQLEHATGRGSFRGMGLGVR